MEAADLARRSAASELAATALGAYATPSLPTLPHVSGAATPPPGEDRFVSELAALWGRLDAQAEATEEWLHRRLHLHTGRDSIGQSGPPGTGGNGCRSGEAQLTALEALELAILARRYLLDPLADHAHLLLRKALDVDEALSASDLIPLLMRAQQMCEFGALEALGEWAVEHWEAVHAHHDRWLTLSPSALPPCVRAVGIEGLRSLLDGLRTEMLRTRYGL